MMYLFESQQQQIGLQSSTTNVRTNESIEQDQLKKEQASLQKAEDAEKHKSFWQKVGNVCGTIAEIAGVVASVAAAVCSGGSTLAVAAAILSVASFTDGETHVLEKLGVDPGVAEVVDMSMSLGGGALSVGAVLAQGAKVADSTAATVGKIASGVSAVNQVGHGAATIAASVSQKQADESDADAAASEAQQNAIRRLIQRIIQAEENSNGQDQKAMQTIAGIKSTQNETASIAATGMKG
jgi:hypothetical protein